MLSVRQGEPAKRTVKVLRAMLRGCWLLSWDWVLDSIAADGWLPEEKYEVQVPVRSPTLQCPRSALAQATCCLVQHFMLCSTPQRTNTSSHEEKHSQRIQSHISLMPCIVCFRGSRQGWIGPTGLPGRAGGTATASRSCCR